MNITIIGAGPIGCYAGYLLAKEGHLVTIYENHPQIGSPIQCTGILTSDFDQFGFSLDSFLVNTIDSIEVYSPSNKKIVIKQKDYIVCRIKFDNFFADKARKAGAKILVNHSFQRKEGKELIIKDTKNNTEIRVNPDIVIAADGPLSPTAKAFGFYYPKRENYYGVQAVVEGTFEPHTIKTYFGNDVCPGLFAWIAPESATTARVGVATLKNSKYYFDRFMKAHHFTAKEMQAGTIPVYHPQQRLHKDNCYLVGDAAGYVKATTLGGLIPGLQQAEILARCITEKKNYCRELKPLRKRMWTHLQVHKIMDRFSDADWDRLISYVNQSKVQEVFEKYTRDNPIPLVSMALLKEPRFVRFMKYLF
ncbi:NAD(P)/FAD-dependent oxidoreductase [Candidatus Woesearchaeota archaeon]|nr:NAD(P)/FAD-dependent oxidoreductase [Candidatus Woesearchaeota archaeon]